MLCTVQAIWKRLFKTKSGLERGTLYQLRNLISRRNVSTKPKADVNAAEDFLEIVVIGYVISAVMSYLRMSSLDDIPDQGIVPEDTCLEDDSAREEILQKIAHYIVAEHVDLATTFATSVAKGGAATVHDYTCEVLSLGLLFLNFKDAVREGDGDRVLLMWKYFMVIFKSMGHKNYAAEAFTLPSFPSTTLYFRQISLSN